MLSSCPYFISFSAFPLLTLLLFFYSWTNILCVFFLVILFENQYNHIYKNTFKECPNPRTIILPNYNSCLHVCLASCPLFLLCVHTFYRDVSSVDVGFFFFLCCRFLHKRFHLLFLFFLLSQEALGSHSPLPDFLTVPSTAPPLRPAYVKEVSFYAENPL